MEYLKPFVKAMIPENAASLMPMLLKRATEQIFQEMDKDHGQSIEAEEMMMWTKSGRNIIDALADLIDKDVNNNYNSYTYTQSITNTQQTQ